MLSVPLGSWIAGASESYDRVAIRCAELVRSGLEGRPLESALADHFARRVIEACGGLVLDIGCGPGWLTGLLASRGLDVQPRRADGQTAESQTAQYPSEAGLRAPSCRRWLATSGYARRTAWMRTFEPSRSGSPKRLLEHADAAGRSVILHVTEGNDVARRLYEHGFAATGEQLRRGVQRHPQT